MQGSSEKLLACIHTSAYLCLMLSQDLCHFMQQDSLANFLKSDPVRNWLFSGNAFASSAASLANSSPIQLPLISAYPGVYLILISTLDFSKSEIRSLVSPTAFHGM